jgi:hypothetical protein
MIAGIAALALSLDPVANRLVAAWLVAGASTWLGFTVFFNHGKARITAVGTYFLFTAIFIGVALVLLLVALPERVSAITLVAAIAAHATNVAVWAVAALGAGRQDVREVERTGAAKDSRAMMRLGLGLGAISAVAASFEIRTGPLIAHVAFLAVVMTAVGHSTTPRRIGRRARSGSLMALAVGVYLTAFFGGTGRLILATLAYAVILCLNIIAPRKAHKLIVIGMVAPGLVVAGIIRAPGEGTVSVARDAAGLGSVYATLDTFSRLINLDIQQDHAAFPRQNGRTFVETAMFWIPRFVWTEKPKGFGARLTERLEPQLVGAGHSMVALAHGEWYVNFGWFGLALMAVCVGIILSWLDRQLIRLYVLQDGMAKLFRTALLVLAVAGLGDYVWVGTFTFAARKGTAILVLCLVWLCYNIVTRHRRPNTPRIARGDAMLG